MFTEIIKERKKMVIFTVIILISISSCVDALISYGRFNSDNITQRFVNPVTSVNTTNTSEYHRNAIIAVNTTETSLQYDKYRHVKHTLMYTRNVKSQKSTIDPFFEKLSKIFVDSRHCQKMQTCEQGDSPPKMFPKKSCYCDSLCNILNDCCLNFDPVLRFPFRKQQFSCILYDGFNNGLNEYGVYMITSCSDRWTHENIRFLCENARNNILLETPVMDKSANRLTYRNMYCAQCNFVNDFEYWKTDIKCNNNKANIPDCIMRHSSPDYTYERYCEPNVISDCVNSTSNLLVNNCTNGPYSLVYSPYYNRFYRNIFCAKCDRFNKGDLYCTKIAKNIPTAQPAIYSFRLLVDLNAGSEARNCKDNEMFDTFSDKCRTIYCAPPSLPIKGACVVNMKSDSTFVYENSSVNLQTNCTFVKIEPEGYKVLNDSQVLLLSNKVILNKDNFQKIGINMYVCRENFTKCISSDCKDSYLFFPFTKLESYISIIGLTISIVCLTVTFLIYVCIPKLLNIHGKNLVCLIVSLLSSHVLFLSSSKATSIQMLCRIIAILLHFLYLSSFTWMNVIAFEFCRTFSNKLLLVNKNRNSKRFIWYSIYAWCTPLVILLVSASFDFAELGSKLFDIKPGYGNGICWITSRKALLFFFGIPFSLFKLFDFVAFSLTMVYICQARRIGAKLSGKNDQCTCIINLKLSLIMGMTWVLAFVANVAKSMPVWYLYIALNSLQGLFIAICFLCSKSVCKQIRGKFKRYSWRFTDSVT